jgi:S-adenosylmethionine-diacylglycerol 3-amino-3-carboxypropyl transferase
MALYTFGVSQEDERVDATALALGAGDRVLCVASAGETPLSLLALGAGEVTAVDPNPGQLHLTALKLGAICALPRDRALRFLGFFRASVDERREDLAAVFPFLGAEARAFWERHRRAALRGAIGQASFERYVRAFVALAKLVFARRRVEGLFGATDLETQAEHFDRHIGVPAVRAFFRVAFEPRLFARGRLDAQAVSDSFGERYFARFRDFCTAMPARDNFVLQLAMLGQILSADAAPACFSEAGMAVIRARADRLRLVRGDIRTVLETEPVAAFDKIQLSNIGDWMPAEAFDAVLGAVANRIARPGRVVFRSLRAEIPGDIKTPLRVERALGEQLAASERCPFWVVVPARLEEPS